MLQRNSLLILLESNNWHTKLLVSDEGLFAAWTVADVIC